MKASKPVLHILVLTGAIGLMAMTTPASAQNYPWCAHYGTPYDDTSCAFVSYEQCMASVSGIGGFCERNDTYTPSLPVQQHAHRRHTKSF